MLFLRRCLIVTVCVVILLSIYYLYSTWSLAALYSGRTVVGRLLGVMGFIFIVASFFSGARRTQGADEHEGQYSRHLLLGSLSTCVILAHTGFRFGNLIAVCGFFFLVGVVTNGFLIVMIDHRIARFTSGEPSAPVRLMLLRRRWISAHAILWLSTPSRKSMSSHDRS